MTGIDNNILLFRELSDIPAVRFEVSRYIWTLPDGSMVWVHARNEYAAKNILIDLHQRFHRLMEILQRHIFSEQLFTTENAARFHDACLRVLGVPLNRIPESFSSISTDDLAKGLSNDLPGCSFEMCVEHSFGFD